MAMEHDFPDLGEIAAILAATQGNISFERIKQACPNFIKHSRNSHPVKLAATFGALLTNKKLRTNCLRLEVLTHLSLASAGGSKAPDSNILLRGYSEIGSACGYLEDPPEDVFVGNIYSRTGNYLVLNGIWESSTFYLQRIVNVVDTFPDENEGLQRIKESVHALLKLSHMVCTKAGLDKNELGNVDSVSHLSNSIASNSYNLRNSVRFSSRELAEAGLDKTLLHAFVFDPSRKQELLKENLGHSLLEMKPIAFDGDDIYLVLPNAVTAAIRRFVLARFKSESNRELLVYMLSKEYEDLFNTTPILGDSIGEVKFQDMPWGTVCGIAHEQDEGHYIAMFFIMDTLEDFEDEGFTGMHMPDEESIKAIAGLSSDLQKQIAETPGFKSGMALFISCGVGRGKFALIEGEQIEGWKEIDLSAADFSLLSHTHEMEPLNLWRIEDMRERLSQLNVMLQNVNGFLNMYAWAESLEGHLIPHAEIPEDHLSSHALNVVITQNQLIELRHQVASFIDVHVEKYVDGNWLKVQKEGVNHFEEDNAEPLYVHIPSTRRSKPKGAYVTKNRCWWFEVGSIEGGPDTATYHRSKMLETWMVRAANPLDYLFGSLLGEGPILWRCVFDYEQIQGKDGVQEYGTVIDAQNSIRFSVNRTTRTIEFIISEGFDKALFHPENIAERELVITLIKAVAEMAQTEDFDIEKITQEIVPNVNARHSHAFQSREFRDYIRELHDTNPIFINRFDDAMTRLGMGWLARDPNEGGNVTGKDNCLQFMNALVKKLEDNLCNELQKYNKKALINSVLLNFEVASVSRNRWHRTAAAVVGLRKDKAAALRSMNNYENRLNGIFQPSRNLLEMIICESLDEGGMLAGELELSQLMAQASHLFHFGGWSDLIRWDSMEARLIVRPLGDVHANHHFLDEVIIPFGHASSEYRYMDSIKKYEKNLKEPTVVPEADDLKMGEFLKAWKSEFGVEFDAYRRFIDSIENLGTDQEQAIIQLKRSELLKLADDEETGRKIVDSLKLESRSSWRVTPEGYSDKDIAPWRFRRRLSCLRRPLLQLNRVEDPEFVVCPGLLREGFASTFHNYFTGSYPDSHLSPVMKTYAGSVRNKTGNEFNLLVKDKLIELGWQAHHEIKLTKVLKKSLDRDYGDIDVLAWDIVSKRVLIIECKDLQFRKTYGEIAEQLADFRGEINERGKNDLLKKHLDRVDQLQKHVSELAEFLNLSEGILVESHIVFKNPVPMQFANGPIKDFARCSIFCNLDSI